MKTSSKMLFFMMMVVSTIMAVSSSSWINMWIAMEINLMSFIPLMTVPKNTFLSKSIMTYFLIQSMASMMFIILFLMNKYMFIFMSSSIINNLLFFVMMMKLGMPPFHFWFPEIMNKMNWNMCLILMTWQKLAPLYVISMIIKMNTTTISMICLSALVGAIGGINQTSTRKILAYSSINHLGWLIACSSTYKKSWIIYMVMYTMIMIMMSLVLYKHNVLFINQMNNFFVSNMEKITVVSLMLSLGGLPPFLGFLPKWIAIQYMINTNEMIMMMIMIMSSLITLSYYLRISSSMNIMSSSSQKWMILSQKKSILLMSIFMMNMTLPLIIFFMNMF